MRKRTWFRIYCGLVLLLLIAAAFFGAYSGTRYNPANREDTYKQQQAEPREGFWERTTTDPVAFFTLWLVAFTAILAIATIRLWFSTAALAKTADHTARAQLRAYVVCDGVDVRSLMIDGKWTWHFSLKWSNQGSTPTRHLVMFAKAKRFKPPADDPSFPTSDSAEPVLGVIGPRGEAYSGPAIIEHQTLLKMVSEDWRFFIWGIVKYKDIFGTRHVTMSCLRIDLKSANWDAPQEDKIVRCPGIPYKKWNGADEECDRYAAELSTLPDLPG